MRNYTGFGACPISAGDYRDYFELRGFTDPLYREMLYNVIRQVDRAWLLKVDEEESDEKKEEDDAHPQRSSERVSSAERR
jgi:hypothetical protein